MEDLPNYDNFTGPGTVPYPDLNSWYNNSGERCCPFDCEWDFLLDVNSLDFDWMSQPMGSLSTDQPPDFATEPWPNQLDTSLIGNFEELALPVDLEQPLFVPLTTIGHVQNSQPGPPSSHYSTRNVSASASSDFFSIPSIQDMPFPVPIPQSPDTSAFPLYACNLCAQSYLTPQRLKRHQKQHLKPVTCPASESCTHRTAEKRDMQRHVNAHHSGHVSVPQYLCPETGCKYAIKGFGRRDHLGRHIKRKHRRLVP